MTARGDKKLPIIFVFFSIIVGIIVTLLLQILSFAITKTQIAISATIFGSWIVFLSTLVWFVIFSFIYYFALRQAHWLVVLIGTALIGGILNWFVFRPLGIICASGVQHPILSLILFAIILPLLFMIPFGIFKLTTKK